MPLVLEKNCHCNDEPCHILRELEHSSNESSHSTCHIVSRVTEVVVNVGVVGGVDNDRICTHVMVVAESHVGEEQGDGVPSVRDVDGPLMLLQRLIHWEHSLRRQMTAVEMTLDHRMVQIEQS